MQLSGRTGPSDYATNGASTRNPAPNRTNFAPRWGIARVRSVGISKDGSNATGTANFPLIEHEKFAMPAYGLGDCAPWIFPLSLFAESPGWVLRETTL